MEYIETHKTRIDKQKIKKAESLSSVKLIEIKGIEVLIFKIVIILVFPNICISEPIKANKEATMQRILEIILHNL